MPDDGAFAWRKDSLADVQAARIPFSQVPVQKVDQLLSVGRVGPWVGA